VTENKRAYHNSILYMKNGFASKNIRRAKTFAETLR